MPILIKTYNWRQTEELVILRIQFKGVTCLKDVDIFTSDNYLKIHKTPYLFEVCLWNPVIEAESSCTFANNEIVFQLVKRNVEMWPSLAAALSRQEVQEIKMKAINEAQAKAEKRKKDNVVKKDVRQKAAVREQIQLQTKEQDLIKTTKEKEKEEALIQMGWQRPRSSVKITEIMEDKNDKEIWISKKRETEVFKSCKQIIGTKNKLANGPRQAGQITVAFTPREFPTPCRESKIPEEQEWLSKQAEARRKTGFVLEDLRPEEQDPVWLCEKARNFYSVGNYLGAVSAYTHALTLNSHLYELYIGRAQSQLALGNFNRAIIDASKALDLLTPAVPQNAEARASCLLYRGQALFAVGLRREALGELGAAQNLKPTCPDIQADIDKLQSQEDSDPNQNQ